ncbi:hypothetical protein CRG98_028768, partial [Punica granatum]
LSPVEIPDFRCCSIVVAPSPVLDEPLQEPLHEARPRTHHSTARTSARARVLDKPKLGSSRLWARDPRARFASPMQTHRGACEP